MHAENKHDVFTYMIKIRWEHSSPSDIGLVHLLNKKKNLVRTHRERFTVIWVVLSLPPSAEGATFTIRTHHHVLCWILDLAEATGKLAPLRFRLMKFDYEALYRVELKRQAAGALSRMPANGSDLTTLRDHRAVISVIPSNKKKLFSKCKDTWAAYYVEMNLAIINSSSTLHKFFEGQKSDTYCNHIRQYVGLSNTTFIKDKDRILVRKVPFLGSIWKSVYASLCTKLLSLANPLCFPAIRANAGCMTR